MGKNKAKAKFNAQRELLSNLREACDPLPSTTPIFSISTAGNGPYSDSDVEEYSLFLVAVRDLQSAQNKPRALADLWNRVYLLGKQDGQGLDVFDAALRDDELQEIRGEGWQEGYEMGTQTGKKEGFEDGMKAGITKMEEAFVGHVSIGECSAGRSLRVDMTVNTEQPLPVSDAAVQTHCVVHNDATSVTDYQSVGEAPQTFDWANDAASIPIRHPPHPLTSRNIMALRTEGVSKPFSSLQRRTHAQRKQRKHKSTTPDNTRPAPRQCATQFNHRSHSKGLKSSTPVFTVTYSVPPASAKLDWDYDPRLIQLSHALRSLGWSPPR